MKWGDRGFGWFLLFKGQVYNVFCLAVGTKLIIKEVS